MIPALLLLSIAVIPPLGILLYIKQRDEYEPEPSSLVFRVMGWGMLSVIPAGLLEEFLSRSLAMPNINSGMLNPISGFILAFFIIAPIEEWVKWRAFSSTAYKDPNFNEPLDGIVYLSAASLGFALFENLFYVMANGFGVGVIRVFTAIPLHAICGVLFGYLIGIGKFSQSGEKRYWFKGYFLAVFIHGLYDFLLIGNLGILSLLIFPLLFWGTWLSFKFLNELVELSKGDLLRSKWLKRRELSFPGSLEGDALLNNYPVGGQISSHEVKSIPFKLKEEQSLEEKPGPPLLYSILRNLTICSWSVFSILILVGSLDPKNSAQFLEILVGYLICSLFPFGFLKILKMLFL